MKKVSEILKEEREKRGLNLEYVEKNIKIKKRYLLAIEEGRFYDLPSESYALGFVKNYANFLGFPKNKIAALFRREYEEEDRELLPEFRKKSYQFRRSSFINSRNIFIFFTFLIIAGFIIFQYNSLIFGPPLSIESPKTGEIIKENIIVVNGKTDPYAVVYINDEEVVVDTNGTFKKSIYVFSGSKKIAVVAKNRFGKETKEELEIKVK